MQEHSMPEDGRPLQDGKELGDVLARLSEAAAAPSPPDTTAVDFLRGFDPTGRHNLVAIHPETKAIRGHTFEPGDWASMSAWIAAHTGTWNLYFSVNEPRAGGPNDKLEKEEIGSLRCIVTDTDPRDGLPLDDERARLLRLVEDTSAGAIPPSFAIDSGGGVQMFWQLPEKLDPKAWMLMAEDQGRGLARHVEGDRVQNIDRIMRLPGTMNVPNADKRAKGRQPRMARLLFSGGPRYTLDVLAAAVPPVRGDGDSTDNNPRIAELQAEIKGGGADLVDVYGELPQDLRDRFEAACRKSPALARLWAGEPPRNDSSGSGYRAKLAALLGRAGGFDGWDYAQLVWVWDHAVQAHHVREEKLTPRALAREWVRIGEPANPARHHQEFAADDSPDHSESTASSTSPSKSEAAAPDEPKLSPLKAGRVTADDLLNLPPRQWLYGTKLSRRYVTILASPGGVGKTAFTFAVALACAAHQQLLHDTSRRPLRVWLYNLEDDAVELRRRLAAAIRHYGLDPSALDNIRMNSGRDRRFCIVAQKDGGYMTLPDYDAVKAEMKQEEIDILIVDPFLRSHSVPENENEAQDEVMRLYAQIAQEANAGIILVHHTKKAAVAGDMDSLRGGSAQGNGARAAYTLSAMSSEEAEKIGIPDDQRRLYVRVDDAKNNMAPPSARAEWLKLESLNLKNGTAEYPNGDNVQVATPWTPPDVWTGSEAATEHDALAAIAAGIDGERYSFRPQDTDRWAGNVLQRLFDCTHAQAKSTLNKWRDAGVIEVREYHSEAQRKRRKGVFVTRTYKASPNDIFS